MDLSPRHARIALSPSCNLSCSYCDGPKNRQQPGAMEDFRSTLLSTGIIQTETYYKIIEALHEVGFYGIAMTGGEPFLNRDWAKIAEHSKVIGMSNINITTNGLLLLSYLSHNEHLPESLTQLNISLDTFDHEKFHRVTGGGNLEMILKGLQALKICNPQLPIRANKVGLRSTSQDLPDYVRRCENLGVFRDINLLSLIRKSDRDTTFVESEFISAQEIMHILSKELGCVFEVDVKHEFRAQSPNGLQIIVKDTNITMRGSECETCPMYCQEGFFTVRVATDGTIMTCGDYTAKTSPVKSIDGRKAIENQTLVDDLRKMIDVLRGSRLEKTLDKFFAFHSMTPGNKLPV